jgi:hypothetical protein
MSKHSVNLDGIDLDAPLYDEETTVLIPYEQANERYQDLIRRHKNLGAASSFEKRRLALALAQSIRQAGRPATEWELALMEDAGLRKQELPKTLNEFVGEIKELRLPKGESFCDGRR